jgi:hypothetical protein
VVEKHQGDECRGSSSLLITFLDLSMRLRLSVLLYGIDNARGITGSPILYITVDSTERIKIHVFKVFEGFCAYDEIIEN